MRNFRRLNIIGARLERLDAELTEALREIEGRATDTTGEKRKTKSLLRYCCPLFQLHEQRTMIGGQLLIAEILHIGMTQHFGRVSNLQPAYSRF